MLDQYTNDPKLAGRYTLAEANKICCFCNQLVKEGEPLEAHYFPAFEDVVDLMVEMIGSARKVQQ